MSLTKLMNRLVKVARRQKVLMQDEPTQNTATTQTPPHTQYIKQMDGKYLFACFKAN